MGQWIYWQGVAEVGSGRTGGTAGGKFLDVMKEDVKKDGSYIEGDDWLWPLPGESRSSEEGSGGGV